MLDLYGKKGINDETIAKEASTILIGLKDNRYKLSAVDEMDIRSSTPFWMDQWSYFVMMN